MNARSSGFDTERNLEDDEVPDDESEGQIKNPL